MVNYGHSSGIRQRLRGGIREVRLLKESPGASPYQAQQHKQSGTYAEIQKQPKVQTAGCVLQRGWQLRHYCEVSQITHEHSQ